MLQLNYQSVKSMLLLRYQTVKSRLLSRYMLLKTQAPFSYQSVKSIHYHDITIATKRTRTVFFLRFTSADSELDEPAPWFSSETVNGEKVTSVCFGKRVMFGMERVRKLSKSGKVCHG